MPAPKFLSTLSLRRATIWRYLTPKALKFLSTLSLRRATDVSIVEYKKAKISIHALLAESDSPLSDGLDGQQEISIHALLAESDCQAWRGTQRHKISIHALLAESDNANLGRHSANDNFYPRSPCGERLRYRISARYTKRISIHALLAESDGKFGLLPPRYRHFYPRSPCGERPLIRKRKLMEA